jgi:hypothetical protein
MIGSIMENGHTLAFRGISSETLYHFVLLYENPCHQNRLKTADFIAISQPINCEIYRDKSRYQQKSVVNRDFIEHFFPKNRDKIVRTDDFFTDENIVIKSYRIPIE